MLHTCNLFRPQLDVAVFSRAKVEADLRTYQRVMIAVHVKSIAQADTFGRDCRCGRPGRAQDGQDSLPPQ